MNLPRNLISGPVTGPVPDPILSMVIKRPYAHWPDFETGKGLRLTVIKLEFASFFPGK